jgi:hypothetical protein
MNPAGTLSVFGITGRGEDFDPRTRRVVYPARPPVPVCYWRAVGGAGAAGLMPVFGVAWPSDGPAFVTLFSTN